MAVVAAAQVDTQAPYPGIDNGQYLIWLTFILTPSGLYVAGGDVLDFTKLGGLVECSRPPVGPVTIQSQAPAAGHSGYIYYYRPGNPATQANGRFQVMTTGNGAGNALQELAAGAYPAAILADVIVGTASFPRI